MPVDGAIVERMLQHNAWATRLLLERCETLSAEQFNTPFDIGPGSLHDTLLHVTGTMRRWADRIQDREIRPSVEDEERTWTPREILTLLAQTTAELEEAARAIVREDRLEEIIVLRIRELPEPLSFTRGTAIVHVLTHGVHHRAQALNVLRRLGETDLPDVDAISWELEVKER
ncbi:MAG: DinB family protein [Planctomycetota bacterium]|jgi:uncharacterized damage-inducible protein DinB